jgi:hypothetical protein
MIGLTERERCLRLYGRASNLADEIAQHAQNFAINELDGLLCETLRREADRIWRRADQDIDREERYTLEHATDRLVCIFAAVKA